MRERRSPSTASRKREERSLPMTKKAFAIASVVVLSMAIVAVSARAQASSPLLANIPFQFVVRDQTLPAGEYRIERMLSGNRSEEHTSELQSRLHLVCRLLL